DLQEPRRQLRRRIAEPDQPEVLPRRIGSTVVTPLRGNPRPLAHWVWLSITALSLLCSAAAARADYPWNLPPGFPAPKVPADNPISREKVELGRFIFYDTRMSGNQTQACASCHQQQRAFTDGLLVGIGSTGQMHPRNSMSLTNVAYDATYAWANPLLTELEQQ